MIFVWFCCNFLLIYAKTCDLQHFYWSHIGRLKIQINNFNQSKSVSFLLWVCHKSDHFGSRAPKCSPEHLPRSLSECRFLMFLCIFSWFCLKFCYFLGVFAHFHQENACFHVNYRNFQWFSDDFDVISR